MPTPASREPGSKTRLNCQGSLTRRALWVYITAKAEPDEEIFVVGTKAISSPDALDGSVAKDPMIDQTDKSPRRRNTGSDVNEARLRQQAIGVKLRQMFDQVVSEPVPDEFLDILRRADSKRSGGAD
jgi:hypothetical protein